MLILLIIGWSINSPIFAQEFIESVDYTPSFVGEKTNRNRAIKFIILESSSYPNFANNNLGINTEEMSLCYVDKSESVIMKAGAGDLVTLSLDIQGTWMNSFVYIDKDQNGFTAGISPDGYTPTEDLVSYSFYNDGLDALSGCNSAGIFIEGIHRNTIYLPPFMAPSAPGIYRMRVKLDWCNIDPNGDQDGKHGDFMENGGHIVDVTLEVGEHKEGTANQLFDTTMVSDGQFAKNTPWYTLQIAKNGYVIKNNGLSEHITLESVETDIDDDAQLWAFVGDNTNGYKIFNKEAGAHMVLAAPTEMLGITGNLSYPILVNINDIPEGYTDTWLFRKSFDLGTSESHYYMYEKGYPTHIVNNREQVLAFWDEGADSGSTINVCFAKTGNTPKAPIFSKTSCDFYSTFELTITNPNDVATKIKYTIDGSEPSKDNGLIYTAPIHIEAGKDVTIKAVTLNEEGISRVVTTSFHFVPTHKLSLILPNKNGVSSVYYSSNTLYGEWYGNDSIYIIDGEQVNIEFNLNTSYSCKNVTLNGVAQNHSNRSVEFVMPSSDVELVIDTEFDPSSPSDPQPSEITKFYHLTLVCNPSGAGSTNGTGEYAAGRSVNISTESQSGYEFTGWSKDGEIVCQNSSFNYTMPASDAVLTANFVYNPSSPKEPQQPTLKHPLTVIASPIGAGTFSYTNSVITYGEEYYVTAKPYTGYKFKGWIVNGVAQENTSTTFRGVMTEAGASVVGLFVFDPSSPSNPNANYYDAKTGQVIIDDFSPGHLGEALNDITGTDIMTGTNNFDNVSSLIVKGRLETIDYMCLGYLSNAETIDLSRTGGTTIVPDCAFENLTAMNILLSSEITNIGDFTFRNCENLTSLTLYAQVPPTCSEYTFSDFANKGNCTVFVPVSAIELYAAADYWKDFTILPIITDAHVLQVNLPSETSDGRYKHNSLEIVNVNSGVRQKYVVSDRLLYTFNGLRKDEKYNIYMKSQAGLEIGRIENVVIPNEDIEVTFEDLKTLHTVYAKVQTPDGSDITSQVTIEWLKPLADGTTSYLRKATSMGEVPEGQQLICRISLDNKLGISYVNPEDLEFTVSKEQNTCIITLKAFQSITLSGLVNDSEGNALPNASVSVIQILNDEYTKTFTTKTDRKGFWNVSVLNAPKTYLTYTASECINVNDTIEAFDADVSTFDVGKVTLKSFFGAHITYDFTYHAAGAEEMETSYSDYLNVVISVFNVTQNRPHKELSLKYPVLFVLDENINPGDELKLTASSKVDAFNHIEKIITIGEDLHSEVTFDIIGKGGISASFEMTDNPKVIAMLYSSNGDLLKKATYSEAKTLFTGLQDGEYTLVSMGHSTLLNSILRLSQFTQIGLTEGKDYVKNNITVESGKLIEVRNAMIPAFDESIFYYTNSTTNFTANKSSITTGSYITLRSSIDFKGIYKEKINNVALVVDLPENCEFVEHSVTQGNQLLTYTVNDNRLTIHLGKDYTTPIRFCVIPSIGGSYSTSAYSQFLIDDKEVLQPIGHANFSVKDLEISVPSTVAKTTIPISGTALSNSTIEIFDNDIKIAETTALGNGLWSCSCELIDPYNLSTHHIYAKITTMQGVELMSETRKCLYNKDIIEVKTVTMINISHRENNYYEEKTIFDFQNPPQSIPAYWYWPDFPEFTFLIDFTDNDTTKVSNVTLYVKTEKGNFIPLKATYDKKKDLWVSVGNFGMNGDYDMPIGVGVDFCQQSKILSDRKLFDEKFNEINNKRKYFSEILDSINSINDEIINLEETIVSDSITFDNIISQIKKHENTHEQQQQVDSLLLMYLNQTSDSIYDTEVLKVTIPETIEKSYVDSILHVCDLLLRKGTDNEYDPNHTDELLANADELLTLSEFDIESSLSSALNDTIILETEEGQISIYSLPLKEYDPSAFVFADTTRMSMTDGSTVNLFISDSEDIVIVDSIKSSVWILDTPQSTSKVRSLYTRANSKNFMTAMKEAASKIEDLVFSISKNVIKAGFEMANEESTKYKNFLNSLESERALLCGQSAGKHMKIIDLEKQIKVLKSKEFFSVDEYFDIVNKEEMIDRLKLERENVLNQINEIDKKIKKIDIHAKGIKAKCIGIAGFLGTLDDLRDVVIGLKNTIVYINDAISDFRKWHNLIDKIQPCKYDSLNASLLKSRCERNWSDIAWRKGYYPAFGLSGIATGISAYMMSPTAKAQWYIEVLIGTITDFIGNTAETLNKQAKSASKQWYPIRYAEYMDLECDKCPICKMDPCECEDNCPKCGQNPCICNDNCLKCGQNPCICNDKCPICGQSSCEHFGPPYVEPVHDPSGFVYEAVPTNRVEGVQATIYYKETKENMYGDLYEEVVLWNAEEYAQKNPLFTDENGMYRWDVPQGLWQVKFEKDGYQTTYSDWLPVPPPQLEVNIGIVQNKQPEVIDARAYEEGVEVQFDKYMDLSTLTTDNIYITANGEKLNGEILCIDSSLANEYASEEDSSAVRYASRIRFVPQTALSVTTGEIRLTISRNVLSYAGIPMTQNYSQVLDVEKEVQSITATDIKVLYGEEKEVTIYALPYEAAVGRTLRISNASSLIVSVDTTTVVLDEEGKAVVKVKGELPGSTQLLFTIDDVTATGTCAVDVVTEIIFAEAPKSSRASGTAVYRGTKVALTTDTKDAIIYFTTDGSCPCDENGTRRKYSVPIVINEDTKILAMTSVGRSEENVSETVEFNYTLKRSDMDFQWVEGWTWVSHNFEGEITPTTLIQDEHITRILSQTQEVVRDPLLGMVGTLVSLSPTECYKIETNSATSSNRLSDYAWNPANPIALNAGWNWLGYPVSQTMSVDEAFATTKVETLDVIVGQNGFAQFDGEKWVGTLETMSPGMGYMYQSQSEKNVVYNTTIVSKAASKHIAGVSDKLPIVFDIHKYGQIMPIIATLVNSDGMALENCDYQVIAFCGSECRGIGRVVNGLVMMNVYGNVNDPITLKVSNYEGEKNFSNNVSLTFSETIVGNIFNPFVITINNTTGVSDVTYSGNIKVMISGDMLKIKGINSDDISLVEVYDLNGQRLIRKAQIPESGIQITSLTNGVYVVVVNGKGNYTYHKISIH